MRVLTKNKKVRVVTTQHCEGDSALLSTRQTVHLLERHVTCNTSVDHSSVYLKLGVLLLLLLC